MSLLEVFRIGRLSDEGRLKLPRRRWCRRGDSFGPAGESVDDSEEIVKKKRQFLEKMWLMPNSRMQAPNGQRCLFINSMFCEKVFLIGKLNTEFLMNI